MSSPAPPSTGPVALESLSAHREALGLSLDTAAEALRIPRVHLEALETGELERLPSGPFGLGYLRSYYGYLGLEPPREVLRAVARTSGGVAASPKRSTRLLRSVAFVAILAFSIGLWQLVPHDVAEDDTPLLESPPLPPTPPGPDQHVSVRARRTVHVRILVDGVVAIDRPVAGGEIIQASGHDRIELWLERTDAATVRYNGERIAPQGRQDVARTLVFIDDRPDDPDG